MTRVKIGVIGCGAIAQVHHMPNLKELQDEFEVTAVCDVSAGASRYVADRFHVPRHFTDYRDLLASDVEAVLLCQTDPKKKCRGRRLRRRQARLRREACLLLS